MSEFMRIKFYDILLESLNNKQDNSFYLTKDKYATLINEVKQAKRTKDKQTIHYRRLKRYDILNVEGEDKLIAPLSPEKPETLYYLTVDEIFDVIHEAHIAVGHGGRTRMIKELNRKYKNVTVESIVTYLRLCESCQKKQKTVKKVVVTKPIVHSELNSRSQIDLIDMQSNPDGDLKFILVYQDHRTKFVLLRSLHSKEAYEVAYHLLDIFTTFGAPNILYSDSDREFCSQIINSLSQMWGDLKIVNGKPRQSQSQGSVEQANQDIDIMLATWMEANNSEKWSEGLKFVQAMKNKTYQEEIKCTPYQAMFGRPMKLGLVESVLPRDLISSVTTEEDLEKILNTNSDCMASTEDGGFNVEPKIDLESQDDNVACGIEPCIKMEVLDTEI